MSKTPEKEDETTKRIREFREEKIAQQNDPSLRHGRSRGASFLGGMPDTVSGSVDKDDDRRDRAASYPK